MKNWKTTTAGILSALIGIFTGIMTYQVPAALATPKETHIWLWVIVGCNLAVIVSRAILGALQNDAPPNPPAVKITLPPQNVAAPAVTKSTLGACLLVALLPAIGLMTGCPLNSSQQQSVLRASDNAALIVATGQKAEISAYQQGLVSAADHQFIEQQFASVGQIGKTVDACVGNAGSKDATITCLTTAVNSLDAMNASGGLYLKSTQAKNDFTVAITGVRTVLASIEATLGGTPPAVPAAAGGTQ